MINWRDRYVQIAAAILVVAILVAANVVAKVVHGDRDKQKVATMTEKMQTVCVGRFLIDLPDKAEYSLQGVALDGFDFHVSQETDEAFKSRITERETALRNPETDILDKPEKLETVNDIHVSGYNGKMFVFGRKTTYGFEGEKRVEYTGVNIEGHAHANGFSVSFSQKSADPNRVNVPLRLLTQLKLNPENKIPSEPGFCIDHAYFREPLTAGQVEQITMLAGLPAHPDISIMFDLLAGAKPAKDGLLARTKKADQTASAEEKAGSTKLSAGPRDINGIPGEQSLERYHEFNGKTVFGFAWDSPGTEDDVFKPALYLEVSAGLDPNGGDAPVGASLSEKALIDLWNKMSSSIRVRPTDSPKVGAAEPVTPPLGAVAAAGEICPVSGWYQCSEGGNGDGVLGGQRQYIMQGQSMPQALLLPPQTLWEKLKGVQPSYEATAPTNWRLVDKRSRKRIASNVALAQAVAAPIATTAAATGVIEPQASVGTYATTGKACPASGWWRSEDSHALDGTRWFAAGSVLPAATFAVPPGVFGKSAAGTPKTMQRRGTWMLVRLAQAPEPAGDASETTGQGMGGTGSGTTPGGSAA